MLSRALGFTLIELLVVVVLIGIVLALVGPLGFEQMRRSERFAEQQRLEALLLFQRQKAFLTGQSAQITCFDRQCEFNSGSVEYWQFEHLSFPKQHIFLSAYGFYSEIELTYLTASQSRKIGLQDERTN